MTGVTDPPGSVTRLAIVTSDMIKGSLVTSGIATPDDAVGPR